MNKLYVNTVTKTLFSVLTRLMSIQEFNDFRLVGGTALSLRLNHRLSVDIDLFTGADYGTIKWDAILESLHKNFSYVYPSKFKNKQHGMGESLFIGDTESNRIKLDIFYTDTFLYPSEIIQNIRMATIEDLAAMKIEAIAHNGRKKDYWDIHELLEHFSLAEMLALYEKRQPYGCSRQEILQHLKDFSSAEDQPDPICLKGKFWELIKMDLTAEVEILVKEK